VPVTGGRDSLTEPLQERGPEAGRTGGAVVGLRDGEREGLGDAEGEGDTADGDGDGVSEGAAAADVGAGAGVGSDTGSGEDVQPAISSRASGAMRRRMSAGTGDSWSGEGAGVRRGYPADRRWRHP
jgi:hypothetical protein